MTDRQRFETTAKANGAAVLVAENEILVVMSVNGKIKTTYLFDNKGNFKDYRTEKF